MTRPRLLDLFCGAGGATRGYQLAGFHVVGVDKSPQPHYCGDEFVQADAMEVLAHLANGNPALGNAPCGCGPRCQVYPWLNGVVAVHASPPCKAHTKTGWAYHFNYHANHEDLLTPTRTYLETMLGVPWVIENVPGAPIRGTVMLCGSQFGLGVRRHRYFETSRPLAALVPSCNHSRRVVSPHGHPNAMKGSGAQWAVAMGIDWMTSDELAQAIPPAYTQFIGEQLLVSVHDSGRRSA